MPGYTKLFSDIVDSSIWREPPPICKVWITLLALCDPDGYVRGSIGWLADKARVDAIQVQEAITKFSGPDPVSRTPDNDGRRIELLSDGWLILNYLSFRDRLSNDPKACATRERVRKHRERHIALRNAISVTPLPEASSEASSDSEAEENKKAEPPAKSPAERELLKGKGKGKGKGIGVWIGDSEPMFEAAWADYPDKAGKSAAAIAYHESIKKGATHEQIVDGLKRYIEFVRAKRKNGFKNYQYANGSTWFNQERWRDEYTIAAQPSLESFREAPIKEMVQA